MATSATASARIPPTPEHHRHAELRVVGQPGDELAVAPDHRCDEHLHLAVVGRGGGEQLAGGVADGVGVGQAEADEAPLGLVGDRVAAELGHHREAELGGGGDGIGGRVDDPLRHHGDAVAGQQCLGRALGERLVRWRGHGRRRYWRGPV